MYSGITKKAIIRKNGVGEWVGVCWRGDICFEERWQDVISWLGWHWFIHTEGDGTIK